MLRVFRHHIAVSTMILAAVETALLFTVLYVLLQLAGGQAAAGTDDVYLDRAADRRELRGDGGGRPV